MNGKQLSSQYKEYFSNYRQWDQLSHAEQYLLFPENLGIHLSIDETSLSNGELYTFLTNKEGHGGPGTLVAVVRGTKAEDVIRVLELLDRTRRRQVKEVTLDLSPSMMLIVRTVFPKARVTNDRFHVQKLYYDALDDMRITYRWMARDLENQEIKEARERRAVQAFPLCQWRHPQATAGTRQIHIDQAPVQVDGIATVEGRYHLRVLSGTEEGIRPGYGTYRHLQRKEPYQCCQTETCQMVRQGGKAGN